MNFLIFYFGEGVCECQFVGVCDEFVDFVCGFFVQCGYVLVVEVFEKVGNRNFQNVFDVEEMVCFNMVCIVFIFLDLLEGYVEFVVKIVLVEFQVCLV